MLSLVSNLSRKLIISSKELFLNLIKPGDKYLIIEILNNYLQLTAARVNFPEKRIVLIKNWLAEYRSSDDIFKELRRLIKKAPRLSGRQIILNLDPDFATTIFSSVSLVRQRPSEIIDEADLDNLLSQAVWRFFDRQRVRVAKKMNIDEIDVLLSDVRIRGVKLDGHRVLNPIGFRAKSVEFNFSQTFIARDFIRGIREIIPLEKIALISEAGTVLAHAAGNLSAENNLVLANLFSDRTVLYSASSPNRVSHLDNYLWGQNNLLESLNNALAVDFGIGRRLIEVHNESRASPIFLKRLENLLIKEFHIFVNGLEAAAGEDRPRILINPYFSFPRLVFSQRFQSRIGRALKISDLSGYLDFNKFGFGVKLKKSVKVKNPLTLIAAIWELGAFPKDDRLSHLAKRRVRWLS